MIVKNVSVHPVTLPSIAHGWIRFSEENGRILEFGEGVPPESLEKGDRVLDGKGGHLYPGFVEAHSHLGVFREGIGSLGEQGNEMTDPVTPQMRALDAFDPFDPAIAKAVWYGGVTCVNISPGSANVFGGQTAVMSLCGAPTADEAVLREPSGIKGATGENPMRCHGSAKRSPMTRMAVAALMREYLDKAKAYAAGDKQQGKAEGEEGGGNGSADKARDLKLEALSMLLNKKIPLHCHAHAAQDIATAVRISGEFGLDLVIIHGTDAERVAELLHTAKIPVVLGPQGSVAGKFENSMRSLATAAALERSKVRFVLSTDHPVLPQYDLRLEAARAMNHGLSAQKALEAVTIVPAAVLGVDSLCGSIEKGKRADLVLWSHDPFNIADAVVREVFVGGRRPRLPRP